MQRAPLQSLSARGVGYALPVDYFCDMSLQLRTRTCFFRDWMEAVLTWQWHVESLTATSCAAGSTHGVSSDQMQRDPDPIATGVQGTMQCSGLLNIINDQSARNKNRNYS